MLVVWHANDDILHQARHLSGENNMEDTKNMASRTCQITLILSRESRAKGLVRHRHSHRIPRTYATLLTFHR